MADKVYPWKGIEADFSHGICPECAPKVAPDASVLS